MRRRLIKFLKVFIVIMIVEPAVLMYSYKYGRNEYTRPALGETHLDVLERAAFGDDLEAFAAAKEAVVRAQFLTRGQNAGLKANTLIGAAELDALIAAKAGRIPAWDSRLVAETAARGLIAGEDFRDQAGVPIARVGEKLGFGKLLAMAVAYDGEAAHPKIWVKGTGSIVGFDLTMVFAGVNFLMLAAFLYAVLWEPVTRLLDERAQAIRDDIDSAQRRREEADGLHADAKVELDRIRDSADDTREAARRKGEKERAEIVGEAREEARRTAERTKRAVDGEIEQARAAAAGEIGGLSVDLASKVLGRAVSAADHERLVQEFIEGLAKAPARGEGAGA
jgi:F-type H+-transporting ATPase subunit b